MIFCERNGSNERKGMTAGACDAGPLPVRNRKGRNRADAVWLTVTDYFAV